MDYGVLAQHDARPLFVCLVTSSRQRSVSQHLKQIIEQNTHPPTAFKAPALVPRRRQTGVIFRFLTHISGQFKKNERNHLSQKWDVLVARVHSIDQSAGRPLRHARFVVIDL